MRLVHDGVRVYRRARTYILYIRIRGFDVCAEEPCVWPNTDATLTFHRGSHTRWFGANGRKKEREREKNTVCLLILVFVTTQLSAHIGPPPSTPLRIYIYIYTHTQRRTNTRTHATPDLRRSSLRVYTSGEVLRFDKRFFFSLLVCFLLYFVVGLFWLLLHNKLEWL